MEKVTYDGILNKCVDCFEIQKFEEMLAYTLEAVERNPYHLTANYLLAVAYSNVGRWIDAYDVICYLDRLQKIYNQEIVEQKELIAMKEQIEQNCLEQKEDVLEIAGVTTKQKIREIQEKYERLEQDYFSTYDKIDEYFRKAFFFGKEYYLGRYLSWGSAYMNVTNEGNCLTDKMDIYRIDAITKKRSFEKNLPCIVPIVSNCEDGKFRNNLRIQTADQDYSIYTHGYKKYDYYRIDEPTSISSDNIMVIGKPITLQHDEKRKKLILSIFLDSFNWKVIKENSLEKCMPNTYEFFKEGLVCEEYYAGSEFTYPSIASYWTGLRSSHHKMLNVNVKNSISERFTTFPEILQENGYFTAKIGGNYSVIPDMGYIRGIDRFLYQHWQQDFYADQAVHQAIEHMEAFKETDQYIWLDIPDLHDVAGMWDMPLSVQTFSPLYVNEIDFTGRYPGTLYHTPSPHRREVYLHEMKYIDRQLGILYQYIKENYEKDEVIITLFSDHGNGFNVDANQPFMSWQRENVPLMIYGPQFSQHISNELIETIDYGKILCHLAGIDDIRLERMDGQLPEIFGGERKEYVFAQSQHPDREYCAFVGTDQYRFYIETLKKIDSDCRINISAGVKIYLFDKYDHEMEDDNVVEKCKKIVWNNISDYAY